MVYFLGRQQKQCSLAVTKDRRRVFEKRNLINKSYVKINNKSHKSFETGGFRDEEKCLVLLRPKYAVPNIGGCTVVP